MSQGESSSRCGDSRGDENILYKGVDTRGALGASAPPDFETLIRTYTMLVGVVTKTRSILYSPPLSKKCPRPCSKEEHRVREE